jgi:hypothetical protein
MIMIKLLANRYKLPDALTRASLGEAGFWPLMTTMGTQMCAKGDDGYVARWWGQRVFSTSDHLDRVLADRQHVAATGDGLHQQLRHKLVA